MGPIYLRRRDAARYVREKWGLPCELRTLAKLAVIGGGPPIYEPLKLDAWAEGRIGPPVRSTSDREARDR